MPATVAILGRPNVGKSTLFNRLVGRKIALVDDQPGVTRDRREGEARLIDLTFRVFDTAGLDDAPKGSLEQRMSQQSETAIADADICLFVIDARTGITPVDREFAARLRKSGKPIVLVANKAEGRASDAGYFEAFELGFGEPVPISAEHGEGLPDLYDALKPVIRKHGSPAETPDDDDAARPLKLAIVGQPNAGKSTLINALVGEERLLTGPEAGITRDAIFVDWQWHGRPVKLWDTAGIRRKAKVQGKIEKMAVSDAMRAIRFAECVIVMIDASTEIESQDLTLANIVAQEGRAVVLVLSKWDLVENKQKKMRDVLDKLEDVLPEIRGVRVVQLSARREQGFDALMNAVFEAVEKWSARISTSQVNRWLEDMLAKNPPPAPSGRRIKIRYATQASARPPTFAIFGNQLKHLPESYLRYLRNGLRKDFNLDGTPVRFSLRGGKNPYEKKR